MLLVRHRQELPPGMVLGDVEERIGHGPPTLNELARMREVHVVQPLG